MAKINITIDDDTNIATLLIDNEDGSTVRKKNVSADTVFQKLASMSNSTVTDVPGTSGCRRIITGGKNHVNAYIFAFPGRRRETTLILGGDNSFPKEAIIRTGRDNNDNKTITTSVMYPDVVMVVTTNLIVGYEGKMIYHIRDIFVYGAIIDNDNFDNTRLFRWPYTNVFDDARACTGRINKEFTLKQLSAAPSIIFDGICNRDLMRYYPDSDERNPFHVRDAYELMAYFGSHPEINIFPVEYLVNSVGTIGSNQMAFIQG